MKNIGKGLYWNIIFGIVFFIHVINMISISITKHILLFNSIKSYNYISTILTSIFIYIFYTSLKKGAITIKSIAILFCILVLTPFLIVLLFGGISI